MASFSNGNIASMRNAGTILPRFGPGFAHVRDSIAIRIDEATAHAMRVPSRKRRFHTVGFVRTHWARVRSECFVARSGPRSGRCLVAL